MSEAVFQLGQKAVVVNEKSEVLVVGMYKRSDPDVISWDFPGGRLDNGETDLKEALNREMQEELQASVEVHSLIALSIGNDKPAKEVPILLALYHCSLITDELTPSNEVVEYKWVSIDELATDPTCRYTTDVIVKIKASLDLN